MIGITNTSTLIIHNVRNDFSLAEMQPLQQQMPCEIRCVAASPSAHMVAVGDDAGGIHLWCNSDATASGNVLKIIFQNFQNFSQIPILIYSIFSNLSIFRYDTTSLLFVSKRWNIRNTRGPTTRTHNFDLTPIFAVVLHGRWCPGRSHALRTYRSKWRSYIYFKSSSYWSPR